MIDYCGCDLNVHYASFCEEISIMVFHDSTASKPKEQSVEKKRVGYNYKSVNWCGWTILNSRSAGHTLITHTCLQTKAPQIMPYATLFKSLQFILVMKT